MSVYAALSSWRPPAAIESLARGQTVPYELTASAAADSATGESAGLGNRRRRSACATSTATSSTPWGAGFFQYYPDEFYVDYTAFRLIYKSPDRFNFIECYHPYWRSNDRTWRGINSPFMQWAQHKGTAIALFNIPTADPWVGRGRADWQAIARRPLRQPDPGSAGALSKVNRPEDRGERLDLPAGRRCLHRHPSAEGLHDRHQLQAGW